VRGRHDSRREVDSHLVAHSFLFDHEGNELLLELPRPCEGIPVTVVFWAFGTAGAVSRLENVSLLLGVPVELCETIGFNLMSDVCTEHEECLTLRQILGTHDLLGAIKQVLFRLEVLHLVRTLASAHILREECKHQLLLVSLDDSRDKAKLVVRAAFSYSIHKRGSSFCFCVNGRE
jgi:hypothetical protein